MSNERIRVVSLPGGFRIQESTGKGYYIVWPGLYETACAAWLHVHQSGVKQ